MPSATSQPPTRPARATPGALHLRATGSRHHSRAPAVTAIPPSAKGRKLQREIWSQNLDLHESKTIVPNLIQLVHVRNAGAAFGIGTNSASTLVPLLLTGGAIGVFLIVVVYSIRTAIEDRLLFP